MLAPAGLGDRERRLGLVKLGWVGFYIGFLSMYNNPLTGMYNNPAQNIS